MFGERVRQLRKEIDISQEELSEELGISKATISRYESGKRKNLSKETLCKLSNFFGVSIEYLVGESNDKQYVGRSNIVDIYYRLTADNKTKALSMLKFLLEEQETDIAKKYKKICRIS